MGNKYHSNLLIDSPDIFPRLFNRSNYFIFPVTSYVTGVTGSGTSGSGSTVYALNTGVTANSTAYGRWNPVGTSGAGYGLNTAKTYLFKVGIFRVQPDAEFLGYVHFRYTSGAVGDLNENGFGLKISNLAVEGESYGASGQKLVTLGNLTQNQMTYIWFKFSPAKSIEYWFGTDPFTTPPTASVSDAAYIPTSGISVYQVANKNGATGGVANQYLISPMHVFQLD
jgi:hypothetical protein